MSSPSSPPKNSDDTITTIVTRYHHLAVVCSDLDVSKDFYQKVGFRVTQRDENILINDGGLELHLFRTKRPHTDNQNVLMDSPNDKKHPGHTHMSFGVGSVPSVQRYMETQAQIPLSGTRGFPGKGTVALFVRDPDRTVLEFERNDGGDDGMAVTPQVLSRAPRGGIDHIGTRVTNPEVAMRWYQEKLGFREVIMKYELDEDPKKNFRPWIVRTQHDCPNSNVDINLILNATTSGDNVLLQSDADPLPGILYAAYVVKNLESALAGIDPSDVAKTDAELQAWGVSPRYVVDVGGKSSFIRDLDKNIFRLVEL